jgi:hypothetical protein
MDENTRLNAFATWYLRRAAVLVHATEAALFVAHRSDRNRRFECLTHLRSDGASNVLRVAARNTFIEILTPCVEQGKDGAIELNNPAARHPRLQEIDKQYCLVVLIRGDEPEPLAIGTFICRCATLAEARKLSTAALQLPRDQAK